MAQRFTVSRMNSSSRQAQRLAEDERVGSCDVNSRGLSESCAAFCGDS